MNEEDLFHQVLARGPEERAAFLERACAGDPALRASVEALLRANEGASGFLEPPAPAPDGTDDQRPIRERPGTVLAGRYKLLQQIGEGGMGAVFMAEQVRPVRRKVAMKIIKPGMDSRQVLARFEAERQALALMDHPHIAKVLDAGTTASGRPYFAMELVKGVPITQYCDERRLTPRQRLELFIPVCQAVQHAHQKGIIHRDLKPSNVLVALYDGRPVPKVIDFGVAKATGPKLTERTLFTEFGQVVGTLEYMSPEQAELNQLDIDTRSDIYSLGVLLYELLTGTTPLSRRQLEESSLLEVLRIIREEEPCRPSTRLHTCEELPQLAAHRGMEPKKLPGLVRGELDWIVMKCLDKDRGRRYETANGLALDLKRYLADEPVQACPPSAAYRLRKFARRNQAALAVAAGLILAALLAVGSLAGSVGWVARDRAERQAALGQEVTRALEEARASYGEGKLPEARAAVRRAEGLLASGGGAGPAPHRRVRRWQADLDLATRLDEIRLARAAEGPDGLFDTAGADAAYRDAFRGYGLDVEGLGPDEAAEHLRASAIKETLVAALDDWVLSKWQARRPGTERLLAVARRADADPWRDRFRQAFEGRDGPALEGLARDPEVLAQPPATVHLLALVLRATGRRPLAVEVLRQAQRRHPGDFWINHELGAGLLSLTAARPGDAAGFFRAAWALRPESAGVRLNLCSALVRLGNYAEAEAGYREVLRRQPDSAEARVGLGGLLMNQGRLAEAEGEILEALRLRPGYAGAHSQLGYVRRKQGKLPQAEAEFREAVRLVPDQVTYRGALGLVLLQQGKLPEAEAAYREELHLKPDGSSGRGGLATVLYRQHRLAEAEALCREAVRLEAEPAPVYVRLGQILWEQGRLDEAQSAYREAVRLKPDYANAYHELGSTCARRGQWARSAVAFEHCLELKPNDDRYWYRCALLRLQTGDIEGYRDACREMLGRFGQTQQAELAARAAGICALAPDAIGDPEGVARWAERAVTDGKTHRYYPYFVLTRGLAEYRAGRLAAAAESLKHLSPRVGGSPFAHFDATTFAVLALVDHRLGRDAEARAAAANARAILADKMPDPGKGQHFGDDWIEWLHCQHVCREAEALLARAGPPAGDGKPSPPPERPGR